MIPPLRVWRKFAEHTQAEFFQSCINTQVCSWLLLSEKQTKLDEQRILFHWQKKEAKDQPCWCRIQEGGRVLQLPPPPPPTMCCSEESNNRQKRVPYQVWVSGSPLAKSWICPRAHQTFQTTVLTCSEIYYMVDTVQFITTTFTTTVFSLVGLYCTAIVTDAVTLQIEQLWRHRLP